MKIIFLTGKGGAGKSTVSALLSCSLAEKGNQTYLQSLDAAHNLADIFQIKLQNKFQQLAKGLFVSEFDQKKWLRKYLKQSETLISQSHAYLTTFNLDKHFAVLQHAPGLEEYALLLAFYNSVKTVKADYLIFDMPPTALTLKFFALPKLSLVWLESLLNLRNEILKKEEIISTIRFGKKDVERDSIKNNLNTQIILYKTISDILTDRKKTTIAIIENPETLSQKEGMRIKKALSDLEYTSLLKILNKSTQNMGKHLSIPDFSYPLVEIETIQKAALTINFGAFE